MPTFTSLTSQDLPFGKKTNWFVTFVDPTNGHIFCNLAEPSIAVKYERLEHGIISLASSEQLQKKIFEPMIGEFCLAKSSEDNAWHRSQITHVDREHSHVEVDFVDLGNSDFIPFDLLREIPKPFIDLPPRANECVLADVDPVFNNGKWSERAIEVIKELVLDRDLIGVAIRLYRNILVLRLYVDQDATVTVAEQLIAAGYGQIKQSISVTGSSSVTANSSSGSGSKSSVNGTQVIQKYSPISGLSVEQYVDICVVFVQEISEFYGQLVSSQDELSNIQEKLQKIYNMNNESFNNFKLDKPCCAKFSVDEQWYRGLIKSVDRDSCLVYFVDYGNTETVSKNYIKELKKEFFVSPPLAIKCSLSGIEPIKPNTQFSDLATEKFEEFSLIETSLVGLIVKVSNDSSVELILYDIEDNAINQKLVNEKLVAAIGLQSENLNEVLQTNPSVSSQSAVVNQSNSSIIINYVEPNLSIGSDEEVYVTYSCNPHCFYVNLVRTSASLEKLMSDIKIFYKDSNVESIKSPLVGLQCATSFSEDGEYYRGIVNKLENNQAEELENERSTKNVDIAHQVCFVDFGNSEVKPFDELKTLRKEFIKLPKQAVECRLAGIEPINSINFNLGLAQSVYWTHGKVI